MRRFCVELQCFCFRVFRNFQMKCQIVIFKIVWSCARETRNRPSYSRARKRRRMGALRSSNREECLKLLHHSRAESVDFAQTFHALECAHVRASFGRDALA